MLGNIHTAHDPHNLMRDFLGIVDAIRDAASYLLVESIFAGIGAAEMVFFARDDDLNVVGQVGVEVVLPDDVAFVVSFAVEEEDFFDLGGG